MCLSVMAGGLDGEGLETLRLQERRAIPRRKPRFALPAAFAHFLLALEWQGSPSLQDLAKLGRVLGWVA